MNKDWTGNYNSIYATLGASNHTEKDREQNDYYATAPEAIDHLLFEGGGTASKGDMGAMLRRRSLGKET